MGRASALQLRLTLALHRCKQRNESKFSRMVAFGHSLPRISSRVEQDLRSPGLTRPKVLAALVRLLESTLIRIGNAEYARSNDSYRRFQRWAEGGSCAREPRRPCRRRRQQLTATDISPSLRKFFAAKPGLVGPAGKPWNGEP